MPSYPLTFPTNVAPQNVRVTRRKVTSSSTSPTTLKKQVYKHPGKGWVIDVKLQQMGRVDAAAWTQFFEDLDGEAGTFEFDLNPHCPGLTPGVVLFQLAESDVGWDSELATSFGFSFRAVSA